MERTQRRRIATIRGTAASHSKPADPRPVKQPTASRRIVLIRYGEFVGGKARR
jgi:hypothetical protein